MCNRGNAGVKCMHGFFRRAFINQVCSCPLDSRAYSISFTVFIASKRRVELIVWSGDPIHLECIRLFAKD